MKGIWNGERFLTDDHGLPVVGDDLYLLNAIESMQGAANLEVKEICNDEELIEWIKQNIAEYEHIKPRQPDICDLLKIIGEQIVSEA